MNDEQPSSDAKGFPAPDEGILVTHFLIVRNVARVEGVLLQRAGR